MCKEGDNFEQTRTRVHVINNKLPAKACVVVRVTEIYKRHVGRAAEKQVA